MVLVLLLLGIIILTILLSAILMLSTLRINIKTLEIQNILVPEITYDLKAEICLYLFGKIPFFKTNINKSKLNKLKIGEKLKSTRLNANIKLNAETIEKLKILSPKLKSLKLDFKLGTEDVLYTSFIVFILSTFISLILPHIAEQKSSSKIKYDISPLYTGKNIFSLNLNSIICIKMVHIINIIYIVLRKRRDEKNERTSNRRAYAHSYE